MRQQSVQCKATNSAFWAQFGLSQQWYILSQTDAVRRVRWDVLVPNLNFNLCLFSARQHSALYAIARPSVCPSVRLSHGWISQKRLRLASCNFHQ